MFVTYDVVTCEIKLLQNNLSLRRRPISACRETRPKSFQNYLKDLLQLMNIFQRVQCR